MLCTIFFGMQSLKNMLDNTTLLSSLDPTTIPGFTSASDRAVEKVIGKQWDMKTVTAGAVALAATLVRSHILKNSEPHNDFLFQSLYALSVDSSFQDLNKVGTDWQAQFASFKHHITTLLQAEKNQDGVQSMHQTMAWLNGHLFG